MSSINYNYNYENIGTRTGSGSKAAAKSAVNPELDSCKKSVLDTLPISNGTFYHATDTDEFYYDFNGERRLLDIYGSADLEELKAQLQAAVDSMNTHVSNGSIHVTTSDKNKWNNKQDKLDNANVLKNITSEKMTAWDNAASTAVVNLDMNQTSGDFVKYVKQENGQVSAEGGSFVTEITNASGTVAPTEGAVKNYVDNNFVKSVNGAKGDVTVRTFTEVPDSIEIDGEVHTIRKDRSLGDFCADIDQYLQPEAGTAYMAEVRFGENEDEPYDEDAVLMPESLGNAEMLIYVPESGVYVLEMASTNGYDADGRGGKWTAICWGSDVKLPWQGNVTCPQVETSDGYQYVAQNNSDGISKYYLENVYKPQAFTDITKAINAKLYESDSTVDVDADFVDGITTLALCQAIKACNPKVGSAYMTKARLTDYPESFRGTSGMNTGELLIYVPSNGLYVIDMYTTNNFTDAGNGDEIDSGKYTTIFDAYYNSVGRLVSTWEASLVCPQQATDVDGKYKYVPTKDWHSVSKYHLDKELSGKLNVLPLVDEPGNPGNGYPYWIPYDTVISPETDKLKVTLKCLTLDNNLTKMSFDKELATATTTTAGVMSATDKTKLDGISGTTLPTSEIQQDWETSLPTLSENGDKYVTANDVIAFIQDAILKKKSEEVVASNNIAYISGYSVGGDVIDITSLNAFTLNETGSTEIEFMASPEISTFDTENDDETEPIKVVVNIPSEEYSISSWLVWNSLSSIYNVVEFEKNSRHETIVINGNTFTSWTRKGDTGAINATRKYKITITKN